jgi:predicted N-formylglutamate amidohydrolase
MRDLKQLTDAIEVRAGHADAHVLVTCEHASQRMPVGWRWPDRDRRLIDTHWAYDLGAAEMTRDLATGLGAVAVLSRYTRLLIDPNRPEGSPTLFRQHADGVPVELNTTELDDVERHRRIERLWRPYHEAIDRELGMSRASVLFAIHTFTPLYEGMRRTLEIGVLFDREEALATELAEQIGARGYKVALNEPYSGKEGLMYAGETHAQAHGRKAVELEVRQDLAIDPHFRADFVKLLHELL